MLATIKRWGNSASVRIPANVLKAANLSIDAPVRVREHNGSIIIQPAGQYHDLDTLVAGITPENRHDEASFGAAVGREIW
jgi:antitoxin MazE